MLFGCSMHLDKELIRLKPRGRIHHQATAYLTSKPLSSLSEDVPFSFELDVVGKVSPVAPQVFFVDRRLVDFLGNVIALGHTTAPDLVNGLLPLIHGDVDTDSAAIFSEGKSRGDVFGVVDFTNDDDVFVFIKVLSALSFLSSNQSSSQYRSQPLP